MIFFSITLNLNPIKMKKKEQQTFILHNLFTDFLLWSGKIGFSSSLNGFASSSVIDLCSQQSWDGNTDQSHVILNADGVYMATISALWLNLKLSLSGFYTDTESSIPPISEVSYTCNLWPSLRWLAFIQKSVPELAGTSFKQLTLLIKVCLPFERTPATFTELQNAQ